MLNILSVNICIYVKDLEKNLKNCKKIVKIKILEIAQSVGKFLIPILFKDRLQKIWPWSIMKL